MMNERFAMPFPSGLGGDPPCPPLESYATAQHGWLSSLTALLCAHLEPPCPR
jgi:hypothetical protein